MHKLFCGKTKRQMTLEMLECLNIQRETNDQAKADWLTNPPNYTAALAVEAGEAIDHLDFKWWKGREAYSSPDIEQAQMELVDIAHFMFSISLVDMLPEILKVKNAQVNNQIYRRAAFLIDNQPDLVELNIPAAVDHILRLTRNRGDYQSWMNAMACLGMTWQDFYVKFVGKATLNRFRMAKGYGSSYQKEWLKGIEDNQFLTAIIEAKVANGQEISIEGLFIALERTYQFHTKTGSDMPVTVVDIQVQVTKSGKTLMESKQVAICL